MTRPSGQRCTLHVMCASPSGLARRRRPNPKTTENAVVCHSDPSSPRSAASALCLTPLCVMKLLKGILLPALLLALHPFAAAKKDEPAVYETTFDSEIANLFYFDDSEVVLLVQVDDRSVWRSEDAGRTWKTVGDMQTIGVVKNPFDNHVAIILGTDLVHWITFDQGATWSDFHTEAPPSLTESPINFHALDRNKILYSGLENCYSAPCLGQVGIPCIGLGEWLTVLQTWYTTDGFRSRPEPLRASRKMCMWAKGAEQFLMNDKRYDDRVLCIVSGRYSDFMKDFRLLISDELSFPPANVGFG